jgi:hypothetical protein
MKLVMFLVVMLAILGFIYYIGGDTISIQAGSDHKIVLEPMKRADEGKKIVEGRQDDMRQKIDEVNK